MTTDEEFLELARECGAEVMEAETFTPVYGLFDNELLTLCREIERRTLEGAAEKCDKYSKTKWQAYTQPLNHLAHGNPHTKGQFDGAEDCASAIRAMIKEKE